MIVGMVVILVAGVVTGIVVAVVVAHGVYCRCPPDQARYCSG